MKPQHREREAFEHQGDHGRQEDFADAFHRSHDFPLGNDVHGIDVLHTFETVLVTLMDGVDSDVFR